MSSTNSLKAQYILLLVILIEIWQGGSPVAGQNVSGSDGNIFSLPNQQGSASTSAPKNAIVHPDLSEDTFKGRVSGANQRPDLTSEKGFPSLDEIRALPSLTNDQLKAINALAQKQRDAVSRLTEQLANINAELARRKDKSGLVPSQNLSQLPPVAPALNKIESPILNSWVDYPDSTLATAEADTKSQIQNERQNFRNGVIAVLNHDQLEQLDEMRRGKLLIESKSNLNSTPPTPNNDSAKPTAPVSRNLFVQMATSLTRYGLLRMLRP